MTTTATPQRYTVDVTGVQMHGSSFVGLVPLADGPLLRASDVLPLLKRLETLEGLAVQAARVRHEDVPWSDLCTCGGRTPCLAARLAECAMPSAAGAVAEGGGATSERSVAAVFTEWDRRYRADPTRFMSEAARLLPETPSTYGEAAARYFLAIAKELGVELSTEASQ